MSQTASAKQRNLDIEKHAEMVFGNAEKAVKWLAQPNRALDGKSPLALLSSENGFAHVKNLLDRIDYGVLA